MAQRDSWGKSLDCLKELLDDLVIDSISITEEELGRGAFGVIKKVSYNGASCAGKQLHSIFFQGTHREERNKLMTKFSQECRFHSKQRHPNIVQLFGVHFSRIEELPVMVMELMETSLHCCLEEYPNIPSGLKNQMLLDVALGLLHLHRQMVIHRDLTASNILLTSGMRAKIGDLGMAKIMEMERQNQVLTTTPGNLVAMPPEACSINPVYSFKLDIFSYGTLILHVLTQEHPVPSSALYKLDPAQPTGKITLTAAERREQYIRKLEKGTLLYSLVMRCLSDDQELRPSTSMVVREIQVITQGNPPPGSTSLLGVEMHQCMRKYEERLEALEGDIAKKHKTIEHFQAALTQQTSGMERKQSKLEALERANKVLQQLVSSKLSSWSNQVSSKEPEASAPQVPVRNYAKYASMTSRRRERERGGGRASVTLLAKSRSQGTLVTRLPAAPAVGDDRRHVTLIEDQGGQITVSHSLDEIKRHSLISSVHIANKPNLPMPLYNAQAVNLRGTIYVGGQRKENPFEIYRYQPKEDTWEYFIPAPTTRYALTCFSNQLICVGGLDAMSRQYTTNVFALDDRSGTPGKWSLMLAGMMCARADASAIGFSGSMVVAGGHNDLGMLDSIEVYYSDTGQWSLVEHPHSWIGRSGLRTAFFENCWYLMGGERGDQLSARVEYIFISSLIGKVRKLKSSANSLEESVKSLPTLPLSGASVAILDGRIFAVGGEDPYRNRKGKPSCSAEIYVLIQDSWVWAGKIPEQLTQSLVIPLSDTEALVCGGMGNSNRPSSSVFKITLK